NPYTNAAYQPPSTNSASSGGTITSRRTATGVFSVVFAGLARPAGATEIVLVSAFAGQGYYCGVDSWTSGASDLTATVKCFNPAGGVPVDGAFNILLI